MADGLLAQYLPFPAARIIRQEIADRRRWS
jgi:hypothetical protein